MIAVTPEKVVEDIAVVSALSLFNDLVRSHVIDEVDLSQGAVAAGATKYVEARRISVEPVQWKIFSHCASVTRLYALYEGFVYDLISAWLKILPSLYPRYGLLPEAIITQHRIGIGILLQKYGRGFRNEELTELRILEPLYAGLSGLESFSLISDAFFVDSRNLRHDELCTLFGKASLSDLRGWLSGHEQLRELCEGGGTTIVARLKELVEFRNEASHARQEIDQTLGVSAFQQIAEFVQLLCRALHEYVNIRYFDVLQRTGRLETIGKITEYFRIPDAAILTLGGSVQVSTGDAVFVRGSRQSVTAVIVSLREVDQPRETVSGAMGSELGVKFEPRVTAVGSTVYRVRPVPEESRGEKPDKGSAAAAEALGEEELPTATGDR